MKIKIQLNDIPLSNSEINGKGHLGVYINLEDRKGAGNPRKTIAVHGSDTNDAKETKYLKWVDNELKDLDKLTIEIMPKIMDGDPPLEIKTSIKDKDCFTISESYADQIIESSLKCTRELNELLYKLKSVVPAAEYKKIGFGVGKSIYEIFDSLLDPVYRVYPEKRPEEYRDMPL